MSQHQPGYGPPQPPWGPTPPPQKRPSAGKFIGFGCLGVVALFVVIAVIGAVVGSDDDGAENTAATATSSPSDTGDGKNSASPTPSAAASTAKNEDDDTARLPDMRGKGLQSAQDQAQAAGFYHLTSHDALGRGRMQVLDRNWKVCSQTPAAGDRPTDTKVDFGAVKLEEDCPADDQGTVAEAGATMPDFVGKSVKVARAALDSSTSITVTDASGDDRFVIVESNWQVCTQAPKAGAVLDGQPVTFTAVKFDESC
ncbi:hypothetical protein [Streptomyces sp. NPDC018693]|uniref:hypothetical protein n=1 Tax=unclassified Streptomyces TaxID=2593676 RepID=UPI0037B3467C